MLLHKVSYTSACDDDYKALLLPHQVRFRTILATFARKMRYVSFSLMLTIVHSKAQSNVKGKKGWPLRWELREQALRAIRQKNNADETLVSCDRQTTLLNLRIFEDIKWASVRLFFR